MRAVYLLLIILLAAVGFVYVLSTQNPGSPSGPPQFNAKGNGGAVWMVGVQSSDASAIPNSGVRGFMQVVSYQAPGSLAFWVSDDLSNNLWGQVGYFISQGGVPVAFFQIWNLNTSVIVFEGSTSTSVGNHTFSMYRSNGTNWDYAVDDLVFGTYDMQTATSSPAYPVYALSEEQSNTTFPFPSVTFGPALQVFRNGAWATVQLARTYGSAWGVEGNDQSPSIPRGSAVVGGNLSSIPAGSTLWSFPAVTAGGAVPIPAIQAAARGSSSRVVWPERS
ncbi:MAG TPA: hypothetical protein VLY21_06375 [Nitrososphaerales archaeon]|nr:hypothetical protein [Nitrososphaerales archaeon]